MLSVSLGKWILTKTFVKLAPQAYISMQVTHLHTTATVVPVAWFLAFSSHGGLC